MPRDWGSRTFAVAGWARVAISILSLAATFLPWMTVGIVTRTRHWNAYQLGGLAWIWLVLDVGAVVVSAVATRQFVAPFWRNAWTVFGAASLGVSLSAIVLVGVSAHVSAILTAPNPLRVDYGLPVFAILTALWTLSSFMPWRS